MDDTRDFTELVDLAAEGLGGRVLAANDEFFAPKEALLKPGEAEWREGEYTERGKWMDGWETRRRRSEGFDWLILQLGAPGIVRGVVIDTSFFRGNFPERASIEGCALNGTPGLDELIDAPSWHELLPPSLLAGDTKNKFRIADDRRVTHLRLNIFPDGGVARLRVHGEVKANRYGGAASLIDLAAMEQGGYSMVCSDMFFGDRQNLLLPGRSTHMGNGWETRRRRGPGHDWTIVRLADRGAIQWAEVDTDHYKGNAPDSCMIEVCDMPGATADQLLGSEVEWTQIVPPSKLQPNARHRFATEAMPQATHARLSIYPDGGVARLRLFGHRVQGAQP